jgi:hypothetical protein
MTSRCQGGTRHRRQGARIMNHVDDCARPKPLSERDEKSPPREGPDTVVQMASVALQLADHAYVNGRVALSGTGRELADTPEVRRAYLGGRTRRGGSPPFRTSPSGCAGGAGARTEVGPTPQARFEHAWGR